MDGNIDIEYIDVSLIEKYPQNTKKHPDKQIAKIKNSIKEFGFNVPVIVDKNNVLIAGHGRVLAARSLGMDRIPVIRKNNLTSEQIRAYRIADNKTAESEWDFDFLKEEFDLLKLNNYDLQLTGFDLDEIDSLYPKEAEEIEVDDVDVIETAIQVGDVFQIGKHRLMCGDATDYALVWKQLLEEKYVDMCFTDPPYNTGMVNKSQRNAPTRLAHFFDDVFTDEEWDLFLLKITEVYYSVLRNNSVAYICLDWRRNHELLPKIKKAGFHVSNIIVWDKMVHGLGSDYKYTYEVINVCKKGKPLLNTHQGEQEYSDVWHIQRKMGRDEEHATKKPIELCSRAIRHVLDVKSVIDLFGGSGSTMVACEQLQRVCYMMELDPKYCQVIINRMRKLDPSISVKCVNRDYDPTNNEARTSDKTRS